MDTYELLRQAIEDRRPVAARYEGGSREFCPHALGTKRGERHTLVYQYAGTSQSGLPVEGEWRCLRVGGLDDVSLQDGPWHTAENVFNPQSCLDEIDAAVQASPPLAEGRR